MTLQAIAHLPMGIQDVVDIGDVNQEDADWFNGQNARISLEYVGGNFVVYADLGFVVDGEPDEAIEISLGRTCRETIAALRVQCVQMIAEKE